MPLSNLRVVLVGTTHPGNIGGVARAMKNMGLTRLTLVAPKQFPHPEANARAAGADDVLAAARVCATLDEALADCRLVIGTSSRERAIAWPRSDPAEAARELLHAAARAPAALVFGSERTGLTNDELDRCQRVVCIPADPAFPSLNLACAVQVMAYELRRAQADDATAPSVPAPDALASDADLQRFYQHLEQVLVDIGFLDPRNPRKLMRRLTRLFARTRLDNNEINILRGILTAVQQGRGPIIDKNNKK
jgi:tRNA (cytidine32/uridine32-2'-O)-methyltransferase